MCRRSSHREPVLVVTDELVGISFIEQRQPAKTFNDVVDPQDPTTATLHLESSFERRDHRFGDRLPCQLSEITRQLVSSFPLDTQCHRNQSASRGRVASKEINAVTVFE